MSPPTADTATSPAEAAAIAVLPAHLAREWQLFVDWCAATGHPSLPSTSTVVGAFIAQLPAAPDVMARRVRAIRAAHRCAAAADPAPDPVVDPPRRARAVGERYAGAGWAEPSDVLARLAGFHYPAGVAARRDAVIVLLCVLLGTTRRQALNARAGVWPVPCLNGTDLAFTVDPATCHACTLSRWLRVLAADAGGGRQLVECVMGESRSGFHDCRLETPALTRRPLLPAIDRHGWIAHRESLSARALSQVLTRRMDLRTAPPEAASSGRAPLTGDRLVVGRRNHDALRELDALLARLEAALGGSGG